MRTANRAFLLLVSMLCALLPAPWCDLSHNAKGETCTSAAMVEGRMIDLPVVYPDGSIRFHVAAGPVEADRGTVPVPVGGNQTPATVLVEDSFDAGDKSPADRTLFPLHLPNRRWVDATEPITPVPMDLNKNRLQQQGVRTVKEIHYWGHYPVADLEFETDAPIRVGLRAWAPFLPGDVVGSMLPGAVFEVHLRNPSEAKQEGTIAFSFPGPLEKEAGTTEFERKRVEGAVTGMEVTAPLVSYVLGTIGEEKPRLGGGLNADGTAWSKIAQELPPAGPNRPGSSAAVDFSLDPDQRDVVRFVLAWHAPTWNAGGYNWCGGPASFD